LGTADNKQATLNLAGFLNVPASEFVWCCVQICRANLPRTYKTLSRRCTTGGRRCRRAVEAPARSRHPVIRYVSIPRHCWCRALCRVLRSCGGPYERNAVGVRIGSDRGLCCKLCWIISTICTGIA